MEGIFCGNFLASRNGSPPCRSTWHAGCYTCRGSTKFPGNLWHKEEERQRQLTEGVEGSHLCIPFQCEVCWIRNIEGRDPVPGRDDLLLTCIRRANLDAMLGKSPLTIKAHRQETVATLVNAASIGKTPAYHPRGPFPLSDEVGMSLAVDMLLKSLRAKGRILDHVQYATLRKMRAMYTKNWESSPAGIREGAALPTGSTGSDKHPDWL
jgi:hypothetical protein